MDNGTEGNSDEQPRKHQGGPPPDAELLRRFTYRAPRDEKARQDHAEVSERTLHLARWLCSICPPGRNLSLALTALEEVRMRANAAIAIDDPRP
jgi:hypothetical protein